MTKEKRPVTICHMLTSLNGKIDGEFMSHPDGQLARQHYNRIRNEFQCEAVVYGQVTMKGGYASGVRKVAESETPLSHLQDYLACTDADHYIVSLDPQGTLCLPHGWIERKGRPTAHVIQVLSPQVSQQYCDQLRRNQVSYLILPQYECRTLLSRLAQSFGIERVLIAGGGITDNSFLQQGVLDELSLVVAPVVETCRSATAFETINPQPDQPQGLQLKQAVALEGGAVWLRYQRKEK